MNKKNKKQKTNLDYQDDFFNNDQMLERLENIESITKENYKTGNAKYIKHTQSTLTLVFSALGGTSKYRLDFRPGINLFYTKDEAMETLKDINDSDVNFNDLSEFLNHLVYPIIVMPILPYDASFDSSIFNEWIFDSNDNHDDIIRLAKENNLPINESNFI